MADCLVVIRSLRVLRDTQPPSFPLTFTNCLSDVLKIEEKGAEKLKDFVVMGRREAMKSV